MRQMMIRKAVLTAVAALGLGFGFAAQAEEGPALPKENWSFYGVFGTFDRAA